jgi:hypothetical protein
MPGVMAHQENVGNVRWRLPQNVEQVVFICKVEFWVIGACAIPGRLKGFRRSPECAALG